MSFRILLEGAETCPTCGHTPDPMGGRYPWDPTYNLSSMFREAGFGKNLNGMTASEAAPILKAGIADMKANPIKYVVHNAPNGYGVYGDKIIAVLEDILSAMEAKGFV